MKKLDGKLKKEIEKGIKDDTALITYYKNLPEEELVDDLGIFDEIELFEGLKIDDVRIVEVKEKVKEEFKTEILTIERDDKLDIKKMNEIATITEDKNIVLDERLEKSIEKINKKELDSLLEKDGIVIEKVKDKKLKLNDEATIEKEEEKDKQEIAESIGEEPDDILNIVRINDVEAGSKLFDIKLQKGSKVNLVRLKNNKFKLLEEHEGGKYTELKGYEVTPVGKEVFPLVASEFEYTNDLKIGEVRYGRSKEIPRYDIFQIKGRGDTGEGNSLLYIGVNDESQIDMVENLDNGFEFDRVRDLENRYPRTIVIEGKEKTISSKEEAEKETMDHIENQIDYTEYTEHKVALEAELLEIEERIAEITDDYEEIDVESDELDSLEARREEILDELNIDKEEYMKEIDEREARHTHTRTNPQ